MWIRSQDKTILVDTNRVIIDIGVESYVIVNQASALGNLDDYDILGRYESEERAIQILDQIHGRLIEGVKHDDIIKGRRHQRNYVFQMP